MDDKTVKAALADVWTRAANELGEPLRVIPRWKLSMKGKEPIQALRSLTNDKLINGLYITRVKRLSKKLGANHWEYLWTYAMFYFRSYEEGNDVNNSEDRMNALLEQVATQIEDSPGLDLDWIDEHGELQVDNIDTLDLRVHVAQTFITVKLTKQPD